MPDPTIHSSSWTGPIEEQVLPNRVQPKLGLGLGQKLEPRPTFTAAEVRWARSLGLVFLSPLFLLAAWYFVHATSTDTMWVDHREWLELWAMAAVGVAACDCLAGKPASPALRTAVLALVFCLTVGFALSYSYAALTAHAHARASRPERTYELYERCGRRCSYYVHQRADGSTIEGVQVGEAVPYGSTCALAQRLSGDYGFSWVRVLERSPPPAHEVIWPIRRDHCFSDKPLATLSG